MPETLEVGSVTSKEASKYVFVIAAGWVIVTLAFATVTVTGVNVATEV